MKARSELTETGRILMWKAERMRRNRQKHNTDTGAIRRDGEGQNSRKEHNRGAENGREQTETDGDRDRKSVV